MARNKGAVGYEIGTSKLEAYSMEDTLEIFEKEGYVKYKDLDQYFKDCYFDFENKLSEKEFIEKSKKNIMRSLKYRQFINNEVKMCSHCKKVKPFDSFYNNSKGKNGKRYICRLCSLKASKERIERNREQVNERRRRYYCKNKEQVYKSNSLWQRHNKKKYNLSKRRGKLKKILIEKGYNEASLAYGKLNILLELKDENKIIKYEDLLRQFGSVLND